MLTRGSFNKGGNCPKTTGLSYKTKNMFIRTNSGNISHLFRVKDKSGTVLFRLLQCNLFTNRCSDLYNSKLNKAWWKMVNMFWITSMCVIMPQAALPHMSHSHSSYSERFHNRTESRAGAKWLFFLNNMKNNKKNRNRRTFWWGPHRFILRLFFKLVTLDNTCCIWLQKCEKI